MCSKIESCFRCENSGLLYRFRGTSFAMAGAVVFMYRVILFTQSMYVRYLRLMYLHLILNTHAVYTFLIVFLWYNSYWIQIFKILLVALIKYNNIVISSYIFLPVNTYASPWRYSYTEMAFLYQYEYIKCTTDIGRMVYMKVYNGFLCWTALMLY